MAGTIALPLPLTGTIALPLPLTRPLPLKPLLFGYGGGRSSSVPVTQTKMKD